MELLNQPVSVFIIFYALGMALFINSFNTLYKTQPPPKEIPLFIPIICCLSLFWPLIIASAQWIIHKRKRDLKKSREELETINSELKKLNAELTALEAQKKDIEK